MIPSSYTDDRIDRTIAELRPLFLKAFDVHDESDVEWLLFTFAPGRINFIGEHVDYMGGYVCPTAVSDGCHILVGRVKHVTDHKLRFATSVGEYFELDRLGQGGHNKAWTTFIRGAATLRLQHDGVALGAPALRGVCMMIHGTLAMGAGMSASASFGIALLNALRTVIAGRHVGAPLAPGRRYAVLPTAPRAELIEVVKQGRRIEVEFCGVNVGIMDQFASAFSVAGSFMVLDCSALTFKRCDITAITGDHACFLLIDSMIKHELTGASASVYNTVRSDQEDAQKRISEHLFHGKPFTFTDLVRDPRKFTPKGDAVDFMKSCKHFLKKGEYERGYYNVTEQMRTEEFVKLTDNSTPLTQEERFRRAGAILNEAHEGMKTLMKITTPELDLIQSTINEDYDVAGGRMMGGGFGGCVLLLLEKKAVDRVIAQVQKRFMEKFGIVNTIYRINMGDGAMITSLSGRVANL